jgi:hypothetical protein
VEIGGEAAGSIGFGMVAGFFVVGEFVGDEFFETREGGVGAAGEGIDGADGAIELGEAGGDVVGERDCCEGLARFEGVERLDVCGGDEVLGQFGFEVGTEVVKENKAAAEDAGGDDNVGVDGPVGELELFGEDGAPALGLAAGVLVADEECGSDFFEKCFELGRRTADDEGELAGGGVFRNVALG